MKLSIIINVPRPQYLQKTPHSGIIFLKIQCIIKTNKVTTKTNDSLIVVLGTYFIFIV